MAEDNSGSQESLPLSQESCRQLFSLIGGPLSNLMEDAMVNDQSYDALVSDMNRIQAATPMQVNGYVNNDTAYHQQFQDESNLSEESLRKLQWSSVVIPSQYIEPENFVQQKRPVSSLPASENWLGPFRFDVSFKHQKVTKGISWIFSNENNKLYVGKEVACPVNFSTDISMPDEVYIRAMALFSSSDHASEKVTRCLNHSIVEINKNIFEAEHFIRVESKNACYENDVETGRHSVIVPYENPPAGQLHSTYLFKFMCFGSCAGGPNRRALMVVFTLERRGEVIGRRKINLKVCACPLRDYNADHKSNNAKEANSTKRPNTDQLPCIKPPKKMKEGDSKYCIITNDKKCYRFLKKMETLYTLYSVAKKQPNWKQILYTSSQSSSEESEKETANYYTH